MQRNDPHSNARRTLLSHRLYSSQPNSKYLGWLASGLEVSSSGIGLGSVGNGTGGLSLHRYEWFGISYRSTSTKELAGIYESTMDSAGDSSQMGFSAMSLLTSIGLRVTNCIVNQGIERRRDGVMNSSCCRSTGTKLNNPASTFAYGCLNETRSLRKRTGNMHGPTHLGARLPSD